MKRKTYHGAYFPRIEREKPRAIRQFGAPFLCPPCVAQQGDQPQPPLPSGLNRLFDEVPALTDKAITYVRVMNQARSMKLLVWG
jgi:hypothetical protein